MTEHKAPWRAYLLKALHLNRSKADARYVQIATVDDKSTPKVRTVVFRGFHNDERLIIHSDRRSAKNLELMKHNLCSLCWYFPKTREQFRFLLRAQIVNFDDTDHLPLLRQHWHALSDPARNQYAGPAPASAVTEYDTGQEGNDVSVKQVHPNFSLILLVPESVDYLDLRTKPQTRIQFYKRNGQWQQQAVNP